MNAPSMNPSVINKERIAGLHFSGRDVLNSASEREERKSKAEAGLHVGNNYKCKVKIIFEDSESVKQVETTIWGLTDEYIVLKKGITIPLRCIYKIEILSWIISI